MNDATPQEFCSFMTEPIRREAKSRGQLSSTTIARLTKHRSTITLHDQIFENKCRREPAAPWCRVAW